MANRIFSKVQALKKEVKVIAGSFSIAASGGAATKVTGLGYSVAKSATGEYTITLEDIYNSVVSMNANLLAATAVDLVPQFKSQTVSTTKLVVINLNAGATPTEPAAACTVHFSLFLTNSSLS